MIAPKRERGHLNLVKRGHYDFALSGICAGICAGKPSLGNHFYTAQKMDSSPSKGLLSVVLTGSMPPLEKALFVKRIDKAPN
jgi:hypothetical protein